MAIAILTKLEWNQMLFRPRCRSCELYRKRTGSEAAKIKVAPKPMQRQKRGFASSPFFVFLNEDSRASLDVLRKHEVFNETFVL